MCASAKPEIALQCKLLPKENNQKSGRKLEKLRTQVKINQLTGCLNIIVRIYYKQLSMIYGYQLASLAVNLKRA